MLLYFVIFILLELCSHTLAKSWLRTSGTTYRQCNPLSASGPIDVDLNELSGYQPYFSQFVVNGAALQVTMTSTCLTLFPVANKTNNYVIYETRGYSTGELQLLPSIATQVSCGVFGNAVFNYTELVKVLGYVPECCTYVLCTTLLFGDMPSYCFGISNSTVPISDSCLRTAKSILALNFHPVYLTLVFNNTDILNTCILSQPCTLPNNN